MIQIKDYPQIQKLIQEEDLLFGYFSQAQCSVCKSLLPKVEHLLERYPKIKSVYIDAQEVPIVAGQLSVFSIPTVLFFVQGKEYFRLVRTFGLSEIKEKIDKIYAHL